MSKPLQILAVEDSQCASKPLRVLLVEDSEDDAKLVLRALRRGGFDPTCRRVQTAAELETALARERWDAVISDFRMPGFTGIDALRIFRSTGLDIPFILISGTIGESTAVDAMKAGATDYIMKESLARLAPALERELKETQFRADHHRVQRDLVESEAGLHRAQLVAKLAHVITGPDGSFERWSETLPQLIGVDPAQLPRTTRAWLDILHPDDRSLFRDKAIEAGVKKLRVEVEYRLRRADGEWIHVRQTIEPLRVEGDMEGGLRWFNTLQDVTVERQTEESLRVSESRFRQMAENIRDVFFLQSLDGSRMYYLSPAYEHIWGRTCESLYANPASWVDSIHPDDLDHALARFNERGNAGFDHEFRIVRPDGEIRWIQARGFPVLDDAGNPYRIAGVASDITRRKQSAEDLRRS